MDTPDVITIHQPDFLPWLGFFHRWHQADLFIILDDVQFLRRGWHHRDKILIQGKSHWLTVPVKKGEFHNNINEIKIINGNTWKIKHLNTIYSAYQKAPMFEKFFPAIERIYHSPCDGTLMGFNLLLLKSIGGILGISTPIKLSSSCGIQAKSSEKLLMLTNTVKGKNYLTGLGSKNYLDEALFSANGIGVIWHNFIHPVYNQLYSPIFIPNLSILDILMNLPEKAVIDFLKKDL
ncbi:WbqC family protein [Desulfobacter latus]|uniref:WbqC family protein n=1 Tax=Desulfobacter latus TaxID=2292 RepID=A0A850T921_9BACT|nr:WbqC family protein [Desulfobacter latus]NWH04978.1 WbqC family protein [Desulfobacter latus]